MNSVGGRSEWDLNVCPECGSAIAVPSAYVPPEFVEYCRHPLHEDSRGDVGRNVKRVPVKVELK